VIVRRFIALGVVATMIGCTLLTDLSDLEGGPPDAFEASTKDASPSDALSEASPCKGTHGATSVLIDGKYCIDTTEITIDQFQEFLNAVKGNFAPYLPETGLCDTINPVSPGWGQQPNPFDGGPPLGSAAAGDLNYCAVHAYCTWAGKRMCRDIGKTGSGDYAQRNNATVSEWFNVCSHGDDKLHTWAYGPTYDSGACAPQDAMTAYPVASFPACVGGYPGIFDMSGNVAEWTDECTYDPDAGCMPCCTARTPGLGYPYESYAECNAVFESNPSVWFFYEVGGRCCSDPQ